MMASKGNLEEQFVNPNKGKKALFVRYVCPHHKHVVRNSNLIVLLIKKAPV
jgi:hypothetical protein